MADYWLAPALEQFRTELNAIYPNRDKRSDGWIGDKYHAGSKSDHNPSQWPTAWKGVVRAFDADNDLGPNVTGKTLWDHLVPMLGKHPALGSGAYLIYNGRIISTDRLNEGARKYSGKNPHTGHIHISVGTSAAGYNSEASWGLAEGDDDMPSADEVAQAIMNYGVAREGGQTGGTSLASTLAWLDANIVALHAAINAVPANVLDAPVERAGDESLTSLRSIAAWSDANIVATNELIKAIATAPVDVDALAEKLRVTLGDDVARSLAARLED